MKKSFGFSLAEVLITLGVIGVVAAMTMPTLIQNHQKQVYATSAKKAVNIVQNMFKKMQADEGVFSFLDTELSSQGNCVHGPENGCEDLYGNPSVHERIIPKYLKVVKPCADSDCNIKYQGWNYLRCSNGKCKLQLSDSIGTLSEDKGGFYTSWSGIRGFYTADGMIFYFLNGQQGIIQIYVDVNGEKGPNIHGRDLFGMYLSPNDNKIILTVHPAQRNSGILEYLARNGWKMDY